MNRKILLSGLALAGAAVMAVSGGTFAAFTDTEQTPTQSVASGSLDIEFTDATLSNSAIAFPLNVSNQQPGATAPTQQIHVLNSGSLPVSIDMLVKKVQDSDDSCTEPELVAESDCASDADGEVDDVMTLNLDGYVNVGQVLAGLGVGDSALANGPAQSGADSTFTLAPGADKWVSVDYEIPLSAGNEIQTDTVKFEVVFNASQI